MKLGSVIILAGLFCSTALASPHKETLLLELSIPHQIRVGTPAIVELYVSNPNSDEAVFYRSIGTVEEDYDIDFRHADGRPVPKTPMGRKITDDFLGPDDPARDIVSAESSDFVHLLPGKRIKQRINLDEIYSISQPGSYVLQVKRVFSEKTGLAGVSERIHVFVR